MVDDWESDHEQLRSLFLENGIVGSNLTSLHKSEEAFEHHVGSKYKGYRLVHQCLLSFYEETLSLAAVSHKTEEVSEWYQPTLVFLANTFPRCRAAEIVFLHGYPWEGFAMLRDVKDRAVLLGGVLHGVTTLEKLLGMDPEASPSLASDPRAFEERWPANEAMRKRRMKEERKVRDFMMGPKSGLPQGIRNALNNWNGMFDREVHLSLHSYFGDAMEALANESQLRFGIQTSADGVLMYLNRSMEAAWCVLRVLPICQPAGGRFGAKWEGKWRLLDKCLDQMVTGAESQLSEPISTWIRDKLDFDPEWAFPRSLNTS